MKAIYIDGYEFLYEKEDNAHIMFSTAKAELNFNIHEEIGINNISKLKEWFNIKDIGYLSQTHSCDVITYNGTVCDGDAIITDKKNIALGVFTADCVPVLIFDRNNQIIAAVHSGWKGTLNGICLNTISKMHTEYGCKIEDLKVYIGPHNKSCCYEIGSEVEELFNNKVLFKDLNVVEQGNLNLEKCIIAQLKYCGVKLEHIKTCDTCTYCDKVFNLYSYRKLKEACGRMFSFIYLT